MSEFRVIIIDEENEELIKNEMIDEELVEALSEMIDGEDIESCECEGCEEVCNRISEMLFQETGIEMDDHDSMLQALEGLRLVKKENGGKVKKVVKKGGNGNGGKKEK